MRQKNQWCTVRLKEHGDYDTGRTRVHHNKDKGTLRYRKDRGAPQDRMEKGALQNCTSNFSLGSGSVIQIQH